MLEYTEVVRLYKALTLNEQCLTISASVVSNSSINTT